MEPPFRAVLGSRPDPLKVLETTRFVVQNARMVHIDMPAIRLAAEVLADEKAEPPPWNYEYHFFDGTARTVNYLFLLDALNFSFWGRPRWTIDYEDKRLDGYWALAAALKRGAEDPATSLLDAGHLAQISPGELAQVLHGRGEIPLFEQRWRNARELGTILRDHWDGQATRLIEATGGDAAQLAQKVAENLSSFNDITLYEGREVRFFKRAQIVVADIWGSFGGRESIKKDPETETLAGEVARIRNIDQLTAFADYKLPQILRAWKVLHYAAPLAKRIDREVELRPGSPEEVEIRAATLWAVEFLRQELAARGRPLWSIQVDWILWEASQKRHPGMKPYHRVRTFYY